jgi:RNA polymerase sigma-70 factor (ECF subfamily)
LSSGDDVRGAAPIDLEQRITELFQQLRLPLYRYLLVALGNGEEAEDAAQECFLRLCRHLRTSGEVTNERLWLFHVAHNLVLDRKKSARAQYEVGRSDWNEFAATQATTELSQEQVLLQKDKALRLREAFLSLTPQQQEVMRLREEGFGYREIAEALSLNVPAVAAHIRRAVAKIKAIVDDERRP